MQINSGGWGTHCFCQPQENKKHSWLYPLLTYNNHNSSSSSLTLHAYHKPRVYYTPAPTLHVPRIGCAMLPIGTRVIAALVTGVHG